MALLLDTQILVWVGAGDIRLPEHVRARLFSSDVQLFVSAVTAWEFVDLEQRSRLPKGFSFSAIIDRLDAQLLDYPAGAWRQMSLLPLLHRDPIDRMLIAHALHADLSLCTADAVMRTYPVKCFW